MPADPPRASLPQASEARHAPLLREALRAAAAFGVYLGLQALAEPPDLGKRYWNGIAAVVRPILIWTGHFEGLPPSTSQPENQHSHLALIAALFLVSWSIPLRQRVKRFTLLAGIALVQDLVVAAVSLSMHDAKSIYQMQGWVVLLPWEYNALQILWYLLYGIPLEFVPFLLFLLTGLWNSGIDPRDWIRGPATRAPDIPAPSWESGRRGRISRAWTAVAVVAVALALAGGALAWRALRNVHPLHQRTHRLLGLRYLAQANPEKAEREFRTARREGSSEPAVAVGLAEALREQGRKDEAVAILRDAAGGALDETERARVGALLEAMGSADPYRMPAIEAVPPSPLP